MHSTILAVSAPHNNILSLEQTILLVCAQVTLPLWTPSLVKVGAVGYLLTPSGSFRTLFNATSDTDRDRPAGVPKLIGVSISKQKQNQTGTITKGMRMLDRLTSGPSNIKSTYAISAAGETAHLIAEKAEYHYFHSLDEPKKWFRANAEAILDAFPNRCLREELFLVFGTLNAQDHARFVNHGGGEGTFETQFHVHSSRKPGQPWGYFEPGSSQDTETIFKVSNVGAGLKTVILSRLRFQPDHKEPTGH
ncbi:hypothetical protein B0H16DRAFT_723148 [Mycena metata]|uniref:Uncharacterized protein n=1 Tax=Mycena metata TaxID=1033252 RepID=A0AAD7NXT0_9AGAR|nr:hypothetical protein B0H16DRAFT_723148 [Mycena metata]